MDSAGCHLKIFSVTEVEDMKRFKPVNKSVAAKLSKYYRECEYQLCEYSVGTKLMWKKLLHPCWAEIAGCLVVRNEIDGKIVFDYPVAGPGGDEDAALTAIEQICLKEGLPIQISVVPACKAARLLARYPHVDVGNVQTWRDYLYYPEDLQFFTGRRYSGQRNHVNKFRATWPNAVFRPLTEEDLPAIGTFWERYEEEFSQRRSGEKSVGELAMAKSLVAMVGKPWLSCGGIFDGDSLIAISVGEMCGETLIIHVEKALYSYSGVYPTLVQAFVDEFARGCQWINREDDAGDRGLRMSKIQYCPAKLADKYRFRPRNELHELAAIPCLKTERLTLSALTEADIPAYNALVLDQERNRWWGYDDVGGLGGPVEERSFFQVARKDFEDRQVVNFAVRLEGKLIGEAVLYDFDCRGGAELGCRIDRAFAGNGYGTEAFAAAADWALYTLHLSRVVAKCFRENQASYRMLSSCMKKTGEDETFFYFEKLV